MYFHYSTREHRYCWHAILIYNANNNGVVLLPKTATALKEGLSGGAALTADG